MMHTSDLPALPPALIFVALAACLLTALLTAPGLAPVRQAFKTPRPALRLAPDEKLLLRLNPDGRLMRLAAVAIFALTIALSLAEQWLLGARPSEAYLALLPFSLAALCYLRALSRCGWVVTNRRVVTDLGASLPLAEIGRIAVGPALLRLDGVGAQSIQLHGLTDAPGAARTIRAALQAA
ncbi:hypothetical protein [Pararhodobacter sp. CCB-MM2]|uniref:hypothetical protein n=1 Tax=Pararhodobacter sp. CCB-MM2 TaxID=1786003 RepID=UPI00082D91F2|nr:hypothetical protein [Pararhodobacter sp. CCB-MM2]MCA2013975.1 hypothetical protein [Cereibacter sphaeroides]